MATSRKYNGREKTAILLIALGPDKSAKIFQHLSEEEIEDLTLQIANMRMVSPEDKQEIIEEFYQICLAQEYISEGGINYAKEVLEKAVGSDKAIDIIGKLTSSLHVKPFEFIRKADPNQLLNYIQNEHPQTICRLSRLHCSFRVFRLRNNLKLLSVLRLWIALLPKL